MRKTISVFESRTTKGSKDNLGSALSNLGSILHEMGHLEEAETLLQRALSFDEERLGSADPLISIRLHRLSLIAYDKGQLNNAIGFAQRALAIDLAALGDDHPKVAIRMAALAKYFRSSHRLSEAEELLKRHLEILLSFSLRANNAHQYLNRAISAYHDILLQTRDSATADKIVDSMLTKTPFRRTEPLLI